MKSRVLIVKGNDISSMIKRGLELIQPEKPESKIVIKPHVRNLNPYPENIPSSTIEPVISFFRRFGKGILVAEASIGVETAKAYKIHKYLEIARKYGILLIDLNKDLRYEVTMIGSLVLEKASLPRTLRNSYIISVTSVCETTEGICLTMGNLLSALVEEKWVYYGKHYHEYIVDVNSFLKPKLGIIDMRRIRIGDEERELNTVVISKDLVAADFIAIRLAGLNPDDFRYLYIAEKLGIGTMRLDQISLEEIKA